MKNLCIIQARMGATRFPGKVLKRVKGITLLEYELNRVRQAKRIDKIVVATTTALQDRKIINLCEKLRVPYFRGSDEDVLDRYYQCAKHYPAYKNIIRITGDCPLIDPVVVDQTIEYFEKGKFDYVSNTGKEVYPDGMDIEVFTREALEEAWQKARLLSEREHVTLYIRKRKKFRQGSFLAPADFGHFRLTVDNYEDFEVVKFLIEHCRVTDSYLHYISLLTKNPHIIAKNMHIMRNEGLAKSLREDKVVK